MNTWSKPCLFVLALFLCPGCKERGKQVQYPSEIEERSIIIEKNVVDFGDIFKSDHYLHQKVRLINKSHRILRVISAKGSCGCTIAKIEPMKIEPAQEGIIKIILKADNESKLKHSLVINFDMDGRRFYRTIHVKANVKSPFTITPKMIKVDWNKDMEKPFRKKGNVIINNKEVLLKHISCSISGISVYKDNEGVNNNGAERISWVIEVPKEISGGAIEGNLRFTFSEEDSEKDVLIPIRGFIDGQLKVSKSIVNIGVIKAGNSSHTYDLSIISKDGKPFKIVEADINSEGIIAETQLGNINSRHHIVLQLQGKYFSSSSKIDCHLRITTDLSGAERWSIPIRGYIIGLN